MANRDVLVQKIRQVKADLKTAGVILRCDLQKLFRNWVVDSS